MGWHLKQAALKITRALFKEKRERWVFADDGIDSDESVYLKALPKVSCCARVFALLCAALDVMRTLVSEGSIGYALVISAISWC